MHVNDWKLAGRAARLGAICAIGPTLILFGWYVAQNRQLPMPWAKIGAISALIGTFTGGSLGGVVQLLVARFDRVTGRGRLVANPITAGMLGGALTSILAGVFAVAVFGSFRGPYVGTVESTAMLIAACWALATLLTVDALRGTRTGAVSDLIPAAGRVILSAMMTAVVTVGTALVVAPSLISEGIFWTARHAIQSHSTVAVGCVLGISVGSIFGTHLGLSIWLGRLRNVVLGGQLLGLAVLLIVSVLRTLRQRPVRDQLITKACAASWRFTANRE